MRLASVAVLGFRNLADAEVGLGPATTVISGPNGAGKTNLLEAAYMALSGRSCRTRAERETIAFGQPLARAEATLSADGERRVFLCAVSRGEERRHLLDGAPLRDAGRGLRPPVSVFMPDRLALVKGAPAVRRSHLDSFAAALRPVAGEVRRRYGAALAQRNALLGRVRAGRASPGDLEAWEHELARLGSELAGVRAAAIEQLAGPFAEAAASLGLEAEATIEYRPRTGDLAAESIAAGLAERRDGDVARGFTTWGPHLDEIALGFGGRALRRYGSQGQQRVALLALLFAEREILAAEGRPLPLMLLDDVTSELDGERRRMLARRLAGGQALVTATEASALPDELDRREVVVRAGRAVFAPGTDAAAA